jgi:hypothetical protein
MSALHTTPKRQPYGHLVWALRIIAVYSFVGEVYMLHQMATTA